MHPRYPCIYLYIYVHKLAPSHVVIAVCAPVSCYTRRVLSGNHPPTSSHTQRSFFVSLSFFYFFPACQPRGGIVRVFLPIMSYSWVGAPTPFNGSDPDPCVDSSSLSLSLSLSHSVIYPLSHTKTKPRKKPKTNGPC